MYRFVISLVSTIISIADGLFTLLANGQALMLLSFTYTHVTCAHTYSRFGVPSYFSETLTACKASSLPTYYILYIGFLLIGSFI